jgi:hypothetical protein
MGPYRGCVGGDASRRASRDMKKHPIGGAATRVRSLLKNMTDAAKAGLANAALASNGGSTSTRAPLIVEIDGGQSSRLRGAGRLIPASRKPRFSTSQHGRVRPRDPTTRRSVTPNCREVSSRYCAYKPASDKWKVKEWRMENSQSAA